MHFVTEQVLFRRENSSAPTVFPFFILFSRMKKRIFSNRNTLSRCHHHQEPEIKNQQLF